MSIRNTEQSILNHDLMFTVGSTVQCKTCFDEIVVGEVLAFEYKNKILMLSKFDLNRKPLIIYLRDSEPLTLQFIQKFHLIISIMILFVSILVFVATSKY